MRRAIRNGLTSLFSKVNLTKIFKDHCSSLKRSKRDGSDAISLQDVFVFFVIPAFVGWLSYHYFPIIKSETYNGSISVFSIFGALLFSAQIAMFGLLRKAPDRNISPADKRIDEAQIELERKLLIEVNGSISYLIALSCLSISALLVLSALNATGHFISGMISAIFSHFFLTVIMLVKRSHALFDNAYRRQ